MFRLLDLFCCAGGAAEGYHQAGYDILGVDKNPQPNYPYTFHQGDALEFLLEHGSEFDLIHASPPCQRYSRLTAIQGEEKRKKYPDLLDKTRKLLHAIGKPFIMENVPCAPIRKDIYLTGPMFGLRVIRERHFELGNGLFLLQPFAPQYKGSVMNGDYITVAGKGSFRSNTKHKRYKHVNGRSVNVVWKEAMGYAKERKITNVEMAQSIPPAYTKYLGENISAQITSYHPSFDHI